MINDYKPKNYNSSKNFKKNNSRVNNSKANFTYKKNYFLYKHPEINDFNKKDLKLYLDKRTKEIKYTGIFKGVIKVINYLYTAGQKIKDQPENNNLSIATTFKSQIRRTAELIDLIRATVIFGDLDNNESKVNFIKKEISEFEPETINIPKQFGFVNKDKGKVRVYYNQLGNENYQKGSSQGNTKRSEFKKVYPQNTKINFEIKFKELTLEELTLLYKSLRLEHGKMFHQIGRGKNDGLGTVDVDIESVNILNKNRYKSFFKNKYSENLLGQLDENTYEENKKIIEKLKENYVIQFSVSEVKETYFKNKK